MEEPKVGEIYEHFKGKKYKIISVARNCENPEEKFVVYEQLYEAEFPEKTIWVRSLENFLDEKEFNEDSKINGRIFKAGEKIKRFCLVR